MSQSQKLLALLIDGDNVNDHKCREIFDQVNRKGKVLIKRVYGTQSSLTHWETERVKRSLVPVLASNNKNSADIALTVDAMILLSDRPDIDGYFIVSSDADYTSLVMHILSKNRDCWVVGNASTPEPLRNACTAFYDINQLNSVTATPIKTIEKTQARTKLSHELSASSLLRVFTVAYLQVINVSTLGDGWVLLRDLIPLLKPGSLDGNFPTNAKVLAERLIAFAEAKPGILEVREVSNVKPVIHQVRMFGNGEVDRVQHAYNYAVNNLNMSDPGGWVRLSIIGDTLRHLYRDYDPLLYKRVKYPKMKAVIEAMMDEPSNDIEIRKEEKIDYIRIKQDSSSKK